MKTSNGWQRPTQCAIHDKIWGRRIRLVIPTATPGLVIVDWNWHHATEYSITHQRSGRALGPFYRSLIETQQVATELGQLVDWAQPAEILEPLIAEEGFLDRFDKITGELS